MGIGRNLFHRFKALSFLPITPNFAKEFLIGISVWKIFRQRPFYKLGKSHGNQTIYKYTIDGKRAYKRSLQDYHHLYLPNKSRIHYCPGMNPY